MKTNVEKIVHPVKLTGVKMGVYEPTKNIMGYLLS